MKVYKPLKDMALDELNEEYKYWDDKIKNAKGWGAALGAASEFRKDIERMILRKGGTVNG